MHICNKDPYIYQYLKFHQNRTIFTFCANFAPKAHKQEVNNSNFFLMITRHEESRNILQFTAHFYLIGFFSYSDYKILIAAILAMVNAKKFSIAYLSSGPLYLHVYQISSKSDNFYILRQLCAKSAQTGS